MSKMNGLEVELASMHEGIHIPYVGEIKKELTAKGNSTSRAVKMTIDEPFLVLEFTDAATKRKYTVPVPLTNFKSMVMSQPVATPPLMVNE